MATVQAGPFYFDFFVSFGGRGEHVRHSEREHEYHLDSGMISDRAYFAGQAGTILAANIMNVSGLV